mgnify:CR=1 FL=1
MRVHHLGGAGFRGGSAGVEVTLSAGVLAGIGLALAGRVEPARPPRRPYQPPRILWREPLESVAAVCAPSPPAKTNPGFCPQGPIAS